MNSSSSFTASARRRGSSGQSCKTGLSRADVSRLDLTTELPSQNSPRAGNGAGVSDIPRGRIHFMLRQCKLVSKMSKSFRKDPWTTCHENHD